MPLKGCIGLISKFRMPKALIPSASGCAPPIGILPNVHTDGDGARIKPIPIGVTEILEMV